MGTREFKPRWKGLYGDEAEEVFYRCFSTEDRTGRYANPDKYPSNSFVPAPSRSGLVAAHVLEITQEIVGRTDDGRIFPKRKVLATHLNIGSESQFAKFLKGRISEKQQWHVVARDLMRFIILGGDGEGLDNSAPDAWRRIFELFFGPAWSDGDIPRFLKGPRGTCPAPWSRRELSDEIRRIAGYSKMHPAVTEGVGIVIAASGSTISAAESNTLDPARDFVPDAIREVAATIPVTFVCPKGSTAEREFDKLMDSIDKRIADTSVELGSDPRPVLRTITPEQMAMTDGSFFTPILEFVYLARPSSNPDTPLERFLYIVRSRLYDGGDTDETAVCVPTQRLERNAFAYWLLDSVRNADHATDPADTGAPLPDRSGHDEIKKRKRAI